MPQTHDIGRFFFHTFTYPEGLRPPRAERGVETVEVEPPYRLGKGVIVRYTARRAFVVGWWGTFQQQETEALYHALRATDLDVDVGDIEDW